MEKEKSTPKPKPKQLNSFARFSGIGIQMIAIIGLSVWGGVKLDRYFGLKFPAFLISLSILGFVGGLYYVIREISKNNS